MSLIYIYRTKAVYGFTATKKAPFAGCLSLSKFRGSGEQFHWGESAESRVYDVNGHAEGFGYGLNRFERYGVFAGLNAADV
jgi:hypothetical protein